MGLSLEVLSEQAKRRPTPAATKAADVAEAVSRDRQRADSPLLDRDGGELDRCLRFEVARACASFRVQVSADERAAMAQELALRLYERHGVDGVRGCDVSRANVAFLVRRLLSDSRNVWADDAGAGTARVSVRGADGKVKRTREARPSVALDAVVTDGDGATVRLGELLLTTDGEPVAAPLPRDVREVAVDVAREVAVDKALSTADGRNVAVALAVWAAQASTGTDGDHDGANVTADDGEVVAVVASEAGLSLKSCAEYRRRGAAVLRGHYSPAELVELVAHVAQGMGARFQRDGDTPNLSPELVLYRDAVTTAGERAKRLRPVSPWTCGTPSRVARIKARPLPVPRPLTVHPTRTTTAPAEPTEKDKAAAAMAKRDAAPFPAHTAWRVRCPWSWED